MEKQEQLGGRLPATWTRSMVVLLSCWLLHDRQGPKNKAMPFPAPPPTESATRDGSTLDAEVDNVNVSMLFASTLAWRARRRRR